MPGTCVVGLQWGDEAKGKVVDLLTEQNDIVVRYQGGANAGHTVVIGDQTYKLSLVPSGILTSGVQCVVSSGVVVNPPTLLDEIEGLVNRGVAAGENLVISDRAHAIFPWHIAEDRALNESTADGENIGTTQRGIGPCYRDKVGRSLAIRLGDLNRPTLRDRIAHIAEIKNRTLASLNGPGDVQALDAESIYEEYSEYARRLEPYICDTTTLLLDAVDDDKSILFEGAQGTLLDVDHGTFPFVTSSNSSALGVASGSGVPVRFISRVIGVMKAYSTRVGGGPFPTEQDNAIGQRLRDRGNEYGTVTRRPRRCGWLDTVALRYTSRLSGVDELSVMLLDVLSEVPELKICTAYEIDGECTTDFPSHVDDLRRAVPVLESVEGWSEDISHIRSLTELPVGARGYLNRVSDLVGRPVSFVSVGPERSQTILLADRSDEKMPVVGLPR